MNIRGFIKCLAPYWLQRAYAFQRYGYYYPNFAYGFLPFGLVCRINGLPTSEATKLTGVVEGKLAKLFAPKYKMGLRQKRAFCRDREEGLAAKAMIERNKNARILVVLHLFYDEAVPLVMKYMENLSPYKFDLIVTYTAERIKDSTLSNIKNRYPSAKLKDFQNIGFDIGPFVLALNEIRLKDYDLVLKLHTKGIGRRFIYIYDQIFKTSDWFFNLFDGVLGGKTVHSTIDALMRGPALISAAKNLIVKDPKHKRSFVRTWCDKLGIRYVDDYEFVAGSCFWAKSEALESLKALKLEESSFERSQRGEFSLAHALERIMFFSSLGKIRGEEVAINEYPNELAEHRRYSPEKILSDPRIELDDDFVYRRIEGRRIKDYEIVKIKLKDIRRKTYDGRILELKDCEPYKFLKGEREQYERYCEDNLKLSGFCMSEERFQRLVNNMQEYNPRCMPVIRATDGVLLDGQHRCSILLYKYGGDYEVTVLKLY